MAIIDFSDGETNLFAVSTIEEEAVLVFVAAMAASQTPPVFNLSFEEQERGRETNLYQIDGTDSKILLATLTNLGEAREEGNHPIKIKPARELLEEHSPPGSAILDTEDGTSGGFILLIAVLVVALAAIGILYFIWKKRLV